MKHSCSHGGYALITAIVFLVLLSLIALTALRSSGLEVKSGANSARRAAAFEAAEVSRSLVAGLIEPLCRSGGWPTSAGGAVPDSEFPARLPAGLSLVDRDGSGGPDNWCLEPDSEASFDPDAMDRDAAYHQALPGLQIAGDVAVRRLNTEASAGAGQAQGAGYAGIGIGVAGGGGHIHFYLRSRGAERSEQAEASATTSAVYRQVIRR